MQNCATFRVSCHVQLWITSYIKQSTTTKIVWHCVSFSGLGVLPALYACSISSMHTYVYMFNNYNQLLLFMVS